MNAFENCDHVCVFTSTGSTTLEEANSSLRLFYFQSNEVYADEASLLAEFYPGKSLIP